MIVTLGDFRIGADVTLAITTTAEFMAEVTATPTAYIQRGSVSSSVSCTNTRFVPALDTAPIAITVIPEPSAVPPNWTLVIPHEITADFVVGSYGVDVSFLLTTSVVKTIQTGLLNFSRAVGP